MVPSCSPHFGRLTKSMTHSNESLIKMAVRLPTSSPWQRTNKRSLHHNLQHITSRVKDSRLGSRKKWVSSHLEGIQHETNFCWDQFVKLWLWRLLNSHKSTATKKNEIAQQIWLKVYFENPFPNTIHLISCKPTNWQLRGQRPKRKKPFIRRPATATHPATLPLASEGEDIRRLEWI